MSSETGIENEFNWTDAVLADMRDDISPDHSAKLNADPDRWYDELVAHLQHIDKQLTQRRPEPGKKIAQEEFAKYQAWRKSAVGFKTAVLNRLRTVKAVLGNTKTSDNTVSLREDILTEVKQINERLGELCTAMSVAKK
jgi:hypothetical protein